jgi:nitroimidazol reductase NimA-like FMN-containing flavoprotein (pyridoxamine 5'-phosphate oxidase superfamily)
VSHTYELTRAQCESLLKAGVAGRVAVNTPTGPHIIPVNYSVVDDAIVLRTSPYSLLGTHGQDALLAFEVDQFDYEHQRGWSVLARGRSETVQAGPELDRIHEVWAPRPWAGGSRPLFLRLAWQEITGRRLGDGWDPLHDVPVRRVV